MAQRLATRDFPKLETTANDALPASSKRRAQYPAETVSLEFPGYDLRRAATARDPLAVVEGYKLEILLCFAVEGKVIP